ncbi:MAG: hypothetical protein EHM37_04935 [Deltaproteobacteria bacterium]|nr:MAG: hypothetical protein EHM37_04935 [Deltaproteobacteria bacterium]
MEMAHYLGCILLFQASGKALGEHVPQPSNLLRVFSDGPGLVESKCVTGAHSFHGLQGPFRSHLFGHAFKSLVDDRLCWKPSALRLQDNGLGF